MSRTLRTSRLFLLQLDLLRIGLACVTILFILTQTTTLLHFDFSERNGNAPMDQGNRHGVFSGMSTFVNRRTGEVTSIHPDQIQSNVRRGTSELSEISLSTLRIPVVHCYRNRSTGDIISLSTRIHKTSGGYASTRRIKHSKEMVKGFIHKLYRESQLRQHENGFEFHHRFQFNSAQVSNDIDATNQIAEEDDDMTLERLDEGEDVSNDIIPVNESPAVAMFNRVRTPRAFVPARRQPKLSDQQLLMVALKTYLPRLGALSTEATANPHLRVHHFFQKNRTFAFGSAYITSGRGPKALLAVLWQYQTRPRRASCVTFSLELIDACTNVDSTDSSQDQHYTLVAICTCSHLVRQTKGSEQACYHAQVCFANEDFLEFASSEIRRRQDVEHLDENTDTIFGRCIDIERLGELWFFLIAFLERQTRGGRKLARPWMFFLVLDVNMQLFVPVMKQYGKPFQCMLCRGAADRRLACDHEDSCHAACLKVRANPRGHGLLSQLAILDHDNSGESESDDENNDSGNQSIRVPEIYYPTSFKRNIMPCAGELHCQKLLARRIQSLPPGEILDFDDRVNTCCPQCGERNSKPRYDGYCRAVNLFTMSQGVVQANVYDWFCETCQQKRHFTGRSCAVFPARKESCYTTEVMYTLMELTCMHGMTFRNAYRAVRIFGRLSSTVERIKDMPQYLIVEEEKRSRRRASEAFSFFLRHIDTISPLLTNKLFSCDNCEQGLTPQDCKELGLTEEDGAHMKRLSAVVIDGTAAGILTKLPEFEKPSVTLPVAKNGLGAVHLLRSAAHRKIIDKLVEIIRQSLKGWKGKPLAAHRAPYALELGYMQFWLTNPRKLRLRDIVVPNQNLTTHEAQIVQLYINQQSCFCSAPRDQNSSQAHESTCSDIRKSFESARGVPEIGGLMREMLETSHVSPVMLQSTPEVFNGRTDRNMSPRARTSSQEEEESDDEDDETDSDSEEESEEYYAQEQLNETSASANRAPCLTGSLRIPSLKQSVKFAEATMDLFRFLLNEHIALPYVSRVNISPATHDLACSASMLSFTAIHFHLHDQLTQAVDNYCSCIHFQEAGRTHTVPPSCICSKEFKQATIGISEANPILSTFCQELLKLRRPFHISQSCIVRAMSDLIKAHMEKARAYFMKLDRSISNKSREFWHQHSKAVNTSVHNLTQNETSTLLASLRTNRESGRDEQAQIQSNNRTENAQPSTGNNRGLNNNGNHLRQSTNSTGNQQPPVQVNDGSNRNENVAPQSTANTENLRSLIRNDRPRNRVESRGEISSSRINNSTETQPEAMSTRTEINALNLPQIELQQSLETGICFPGRLSARPTILFNMKDKQNCTKKYNMSRSHTPGLLTVQCACDSPKLIGFVVMTQAESVSLALSAVLTNLGIPPRMVYYDNACNLFISALLRVPWLLYRTRLAVDRFHYKSHKCCAYFSPDSYGKLDMQRTETAESINARIETSLGSIRYMKGDKLVPYLRARFLLMNLVATYKQKYLRSDLEDEDLNLFFNEIYCCQCENCKKVKKLQEQKTDQGSQEPFDSDMQVLNQ